MEVTTAVFGDSALSRKASSRQLESSNTTGAPLLISGSLPKGETSSTPTATASGRKCFNTIAIALAVVVFPLEPVTPIISSVGAYSKNKLESISTGILFSLAFNKKGEVRGTDGLRITISAPTK